MRRCQSRVTSILDQCEASETLGSAVVDQAMQNAEIASEELLEQWQELMVLRQTLHTLPMRIRLSVSPVHVEREISQLQGVHQGKKFILFYFLSYLMV